MHIFDNMVHVQWRGRISGDFHPSKSPEAPMLFELFRTSFKLSRLFLPSVNFTNRVASVTDSNAYALENMPFVWRTREKSDGGIVVMDPLTAVSICNADCHLGVLFDPVRGMLCLLHFGLKCFYRPDGSPTILEEALRLFACEVDRLYFWVGFGAGPCCYGHDLDHPQYAEQNKKQSADLRRLFGDDVVKGEVKRGPRKGFAAYDILTMVVRHAEKLGLSDIDIHPTCSSCAGLKLDGEQEVGERLYWSNLRGDVNSRNFFFARLVG